MNLTAKRNVRRRLSFSARIKYLESKFWFYIIPSLPNIVELKRSIKNLEIFENLRNFLFL